MAPSRPTFTKVTSQMCIFLTGTKLRHPVWRFTSDGKFLTVVWDITRKTMNERIMTDKVKWVKRTIHFGRKHRSFLPWASGMILIRNSQITEPKFTIQAHSSETFNKRGAHYWMSIVEGCILCVAVSPGEYLILLWLRHEIKRKLLGVHNNGWVDAVHVSYSVKVWEDHAIHRFSYLHFNNQLPKPQLPFWCSPPLCLGVQPEHHLPLSGVLSLK